MSDASIDKLQIEIEASSKSANKQIDTLIRNLYALKSNLTFDEDFGRGLTDMVDGLKGLSSTVGGIDTKKLASVSRSLASIARAGSSLAKAGRGLAAFRAGTNKLGDSANSLGGGKLADKLDAEIAVLEDKKRQIEDVKRDLRSEIGNIGIPADFWAEAGDDAKTLRGLVGIRNTAYNKGYNSPLDAVRHTALRGYLGDVNDFSSDEEVLMALGDQLRSLNDDIKDCDEQIRVLKDEKEKLEDEFMSFDGLDLDMDEWELFGGAGESIREFSDELKSVDFVNPFEGLAESLRSLGGLSIPAEGIESMARLVRTVRGAEGIGDTLRSISSGLAGMENIKLPNLESMADFAKAIGKLNGVKIKGAVDVLPRLADSLEGLSSLSDIKLPDASGIEGFANAINLLGRAKVDKAVTNIPLLTKSLREMMLVLSDAPNVSNNVVAMTNAMANLASQGGKIGTASNGLSRAFANLGASGGKTVGILTKLKGGFGGVISSFGKANKGGKGLASTIGLLYAKFWMLLRAIGMFRDSINLSSDVTEVQNVVDTTFGKYARLVDEMSKSSIQQYGMSELTTKETASRFQAMGRAMGITGDQIRKATGYLAKNNAVYDETGDKMADMSIELTKLTADMASFYNVEQDVVGEKLAAIFTGQTRPLRDYGLDLTQATLKEWALAEGLDADMERMTQAEKTMLRYQYVMAHTSQVMGDFARTSDTWANQVRMLKQNFEQLGTVVGAGLINAFKPALRAMNAFLQKVISFARQVVNALGKIFGWRMEISAAGITDDLGIAADEIGGISDEAGAAGSNLEDAAKSAKKLKEQLMGFDKLNVITTPTDSSSGGSGATNGGGGGSGIDAGDVQSELSKIDGVFDSPIDSLEKLGRLVNGTLNDMLTHIPWGELYQKAYDFGKGFGEFVKGLFEDTETFYKLGQTIGKGVNTILYALKGFADGLGKAGFESVGRGLAALINGIVDGIKWEEALTVAKKYGEGIGAAINGFVDELNAKKLGKGMANFINTISTFFLNLGKEIKWSAAGQKFSDGVNGFINKVNATKLGRTFKIWAMGVLTAAETAISGIQWNKLGTQIGRFLAGIDFPAVLVKFGQVLAKAIGAAVETLVFSFKEAPVETALIVAFALFKFTGLGTFVGGLISKAIVGQIGTAIGVEFAANTSMAAALGAGIKALVSNGINSILVWLATSGGTAGAAIVNGIAAGLSALGPISLAVAGIVAAVAVVYDSLTASQGEIERVFTDTGMDTCIERTNALKDSLDNLKKSTEEIRKTYDGDVLDAKREADNTQNLIDAYDRLSGKQKLSKNEKQQLRNVTQKLLDTFPDLLKYYDAESGKLDISKGALSKMNDERRKAMELQAQEQMYKDYYAQYAESVLTAKTAYENYKDALSAASEFQATHRKMTIEERKEYEALTGAVSDAKKQYDESTGVIKTTGGILNDLNNKLYGSKTNYGLAYEGQKLFNQAMKDGDPVLASMAKEMLEAAGTTEKVGAKAGEAAGKYQGLEKAIKDSNGKINVSLKELSKTSGNTSSAYKSLAKGITDSNGNINVSLVDAQKYVDEQKKRYNALSKDGQKAIDDLEKDIKAYGNYVREDFPKSDKSVNTHKEKLKETANSSDALSGKAKNNINNYSNNLKTKTASGNADLTNHKNKINEAANSTSSLSGRAKSNINTYAGAAESGYKKATTAANNNKTSNDKAAESAVNLAQKAPGINTAGTTMKSGLEKGAAGARSLKDDSDSAKTSVGNLMANSGQTFTIYRSGFDAFSTAVSGLIQGLKDLFDYDGKTVSISKNVTKTTTKKADGGILFGGQWKAIEKYASGGLPTTAQLFMAREAGPELVGTIGGHTAVMNNDQIVASVAAGVADAVSGQMRQQNGILLKQNQLLAAILAKDVGISSRDVFNATRREATDYYNRTGMRPYPV